jgi:hypothetical protein
MNAYSFIFRPIIEGEEAGVKAKKSLLDGDVFEGQVQEVVGQRRRLLDF